MSEISEFIRQMPKCDLHCHLDGSMRVETIIELAEHQDVRLPSHDPAELRRILVQDEAANLVEYLKAFDITLSVLQDYESLRRAAYELLQDAAAENVIYVEVRYSPLLHQRQGMKLTSIVEAVIHGLAEGRRDFGVAWGLIICGMRSSHPRYTLQMAELCIAYKHRGVVGLTLPGARPATRPPTMRRLSASSCATTSTSRSTRARPGGPIPSARRCTTAARIAWATPCG